MKIQKSSLLILCSKVNLKNLLMNRLDIAADPTIQLTIGGSTAYKSDWNKRIEPLFDDCLLSDFKYEVMRKHF